MVFPVQNFNSFLPGRVRRAAGAQPGFRTRPSKRCARTRFLGGTACRDLCRKILPKVPSVGEGLLFQTPAPRACDARTALTAPGAQAAAQSRGRPHTTGDRPLTAGDHTAGDRPHTAGNRPHTVGDRAKPAPETQAGSCLWPHGLFLHQEGWMKRRHRGRKNAGGTRRRSPGLSGKSGLYARPHSAGRKPRTSSTGPGLGTGPEFSFWLQHHFQVQDYDKGTILQLILVVHVLFPLNFILTLLLLTLTVDNSFYVH